MTPVGGDPENQMESLQELFGLPVPVTELEFKVDFLLWPKPSAHNWGFKAFLKLSLLKDWVRTMSSFRKVWIFDQLNRSTGCHFSWFLLQLLRFYFGFIFFGYRKLSQMFRLLQSIKVFLMYIFLVPQVLPNVCVRTKSLCCTTELKRLLFYVPRFPNKKQCVPEGSACSVPEGAGWRWCVLCMAQFVRDW